MPSRKDNPDARLTIGYSSYRLPRSGLVQHRFLTQTVILSFLRRTVKRV